MALPSWRAWLQDARKRYAVHGPLLIRRLDFGLFPSRPWRCVNFDISRISLSSNLTRVTRESSRETSHRQILSSKSNFAPLHKGGGRIQTSPGTKISLLMRFLSSPGRML